MPKSNSYAYDSVMDISSKIRDWRAKADLSQAQAAEAVGVRQPTLCNWENDKLTPDAGNLVKLAKAMGCTVDELLAEDAPAETEGAA